MAGTITTTDRRRACSGFTLAEATLALVILGFAAAGALLPYVAGASAQADGWHRTLGAKLGNDLVERIVSTPYDQILSQWGTYAEGEGGLVDTNGDPLTDPMYAYFSRTATCEEVRVDPESGTAPTQFIRAIVEVEYQGRPVAEIIRLIGK